MVFVQGEFHLVSQGQTFVDTIGPVWRKRESSAVILSLVLERRHTNPSGTAHGGVLMTLMDIALGGCFDTFDAERISNFHPVTVQMSSCMIAPAQCGETLTVEGKIDRLANSLGFSSGTIHVKERLIMTGAAIFKLSSKR